VFSLSQKSLKSPKRFLYTPIVAMVFILSLVILPLVSTDAAKYLNTLQIDVDPQHTLPKNEPNRLYDVAQKEKFLLYDLLVVGVRNNTHTNGVFNVKSLQNIHALSEFVKDLEIVDAGKIERVISADLLTPSAIENIVQDGAGAVSFNWMMKKAPTTEEEALSIADKMSRLPLYEGSMISNDKKSIALYIPVSSKSISFDLKKMLNEKITSFDGEDEFFITGVPVAEDTFTVAIFEEMANQVPGATALILFLLWFFFRNIKLIMAPMIVAIISIALTMGSMIAMGISVSMITSMIPIFIMPIAVLDGVHILSEFHDVYPRFKDRKKAISYVMKDLTKPMLFTSLTTAVGFLSLTLTPLPPVQLFGAYIAFGVLMAWFLSITLIPAYISLLSEKTFENFGLKDKHEKETFLTRSLSFIKNYATKRAKPILITVLVLFIASSYELFQIIPNDNTIRWFSAGHELRKADKILNENFAGSHMSYLSLSFDEKKAPKNAFRDPEVLKYMDRLQRHMTKTELVGKTSSVVEIVKTVHRELFLSKESAYKVPDSFEAVAQVLVTFEGSHRNNDLWHFITPDYKEANIWFQLKNGDNQDVIKVEKDLDAYMIGNPPPYEMKYAWFGTAHLNVSWQELLVGGMSDAIISSFFVVLLMMIFLYRSIAWGLLAMVPLAFSIALFYGLLGLVGKDYDGSVAVLSAISLGLSVDYAIHFLSMSQQIQDRTDNWQETLSILFKNPARAISRNIMILGIGFMPLLFSILTPYMTVGYLISSILLFSGIATLIILPAIMSLSHKYLFSKKKMNSPKRKES
jgi:predicted RND superfamily exporter protein